MEIVKLDRHAHLDLEPSIACIGYFDGLHLGHQALIQQVIDQAKGLKKVLMTFDPDPYVIFHPEIELHDLLPLTDRAQVAHAMGMDAMYVLDFTLEFAKKDVLAFHQWIKDQQIKHLVCGFDFLYGYGNTGNVETLQSQQDFAVSVVKAVRQDGQKISTSTIEPALLNGQTELANRLLGYYYSVSGTIVQGYKRGRRLGYPTANLELSYNYSPLKRGVYAGYVGVNGRLYPAMLNVGYNPTFENTPLSYEAHLFDFNEDLYGKQARFFFAHYLRGEIKFNSLDDLSQQMAQDEQVSRHWLANASLVHQTAKLWSLMV